jgi:hypothetical protein
MIENGSSKQFDFVGELEDSVATLNTEQLRRLARLGAIARLEQLKQEEAAIRAEFPELFGRGRRAVIADVPKPGRRRGRRKMSSAARKAVSERMRKYWAERRKAKGK